MNRIVIILLFTFSLLFAQTELVIQKDGDIFDDFKVEKYEDKSASLDFKEIRTIKEFTPHSNRISTGYSKSLF